MSQANVVELNTTSRKKVALPPVIQSIRQASRKSLKALVEGLFDNTDDALFELADRSQSDQHQEMYFDSMRHIRLHRNTIAKIFADRVNENFLGLTQPAAQVDDIALEEDDNEEFALLEQDALEMSVAVSGIVSKVTSLYSLPIMQLTKRFDEVVTTATVSERTNPLGPFALSSAFADALDGLEVNIKIRIILMKLFERFVMERMGPVYEQTNQAFIQAGVLPDLKQRVVRNPNRDNKSGAQPQTPDQSGHTPPQGNHSQGTVDPQAFGFHTVQSLLASSRDQLGGGFTGGFANGSGTGAGGSGSGIQGSAGNVGGGSASAGGGLNLNTNLPAIASNELIGALSSLQGDVFAEEFDIAATPDVADVKHLVLHSALNVGHQKTFAQADDDTVNFVGMLFDYILNDKNLAIPMKALIGRLQIPIVKLAIIDKSFFDKTSHPARALLNELSSAGIGWSGAKELKRDALYDKIESIVRGVLNGFKDDPNVFADLLTELRAFVNKDTRRNVLVEQRVKDTETGKARTQAAKLSVQAVINQKACGLRLPPEVGRFISETWSRVLTFRCVKHGEGSDAWVAGVATLDNLLWVLQPLSEMVAVERRDSIRPSISHEIRTGMDELGSPQEEVDQFVTWLETHLDILAANDRAYLEEDEREELDTPMATVEEIILTSVDTSEADLESIEPEFLNGLKSITEGTWVEISEPESAPVRCKLATITQPGNNYVFVNRRGMKVLEKNRLELANLLKDDNLQLIDESQIFDRALQSVIGNLRQLQRDQRN